MALPRVIEGTYTFQNREVRYLTHCPHCIHLAECTKRRAAMPACTTVADVEFLVDGKGKVGWSGVITLKKIQRIVQDYLENDPPADVAMPPVQLRFEELCNPTS